MNIIYTKSNLNSLAIANHNISSHKYYIVLSMEALNATICCCHLYIFLILVYVVVVVLAVVMICLATQKRPKLGSGTSFA